MIRLRRGFAPPIPWQSATIWLAENNCQKHPFDEKFGDYTIRQPICLGDSFIGYSRHRPIDWSNQTENIPNSTGTCTSHRQIGGNFPMALTWEKMGDWIITWGKDRSEKNKRKKALQRPGLVFESDRGSVDPSRGCILIQRRTTLAQKTINLKEDIIAMKIRQKL